MNSYPRGLRALRIKRGLWQILWGGVSLASGTLVWLGLSRFLPDRLWFIGYISCALICFAMIRGLWTLPIVRYPYSVWEQEEERLWREHYDRARLKLEEERLRRERNRSK